MQLIDGKTGTLQYIAESPAERHGGFAPQTVAAAKWALDEIERLQAENARLKVGWSEESGDCDRWLCEVLTDFRIPFDDHKVGRRMALTGWMRDHN